MLWSFEVDDIVIEMEAPEETWRCRIMKLPKGNVRKIAAELDYRAQRRRLEDDEARLREMVRELRGL